MSAAVFSGLIRRYAILVLVVLGYIISYEMTADDPSLRALLHKGLDLIYDLRLGAQLISLT